MCQCYLAVLTKRGLQVMVFTATNIQLSATATKLSVEDPAPPTTSLMSYAQADKQRGKQGDCPQGSHLYPSYSITVMGGWYPGCAVDGSYGTNQHGAAYK